MDNLISFTPGQLVALTLAICAGITCIAGAINAIAGWIRHLKSPSDHLTKRIDEIETRLAAYDRLLGVSNKRIEVLEEGNRVTQRALLALLSHGIDGNNVEEMDNARKDLQDYLILR